MFVIRNRLKHRRRLSCCEEHSADSLFSFSFRFFFLLLSTPFFFFRDTLLCNQHWFNVRSRSPALKFPRFTLFLAEKKKRKEKKRENTRKEEFTSQRVMPSKIRKKIVGVPFTVNGVTHRTRVGCHEVKSRYGRQAVLLRLCAEKNTTSTALQAANMSTPLTRCTICAVDARGRFLVEEGGAYVMGAVRSEEEMTNICKTEHSIYEALKLHKPQRRPRKQRKPNTYTKFLGVFLATFQAVSISDASAAWRNFSKQEKKEKDVAALIQATKDKGEYTLRPAPA